MNEKSSKSIRIISWIVPAALAAAGVAKIMFGGNGRPSGYLLIVLALIAWAAFFNISRSRRFHDRMNDQ